MRNITKQLNRAISVDALWAISDFFYFIDKLNDNGFRASHWKGEENWATLSINGVLIAYIWQKYPLIFIRKDYVENIMRFVAEFKYIVLIETKNLANTEFTMDMDENLTNRIEFGTDTRGFSANDFWFNTVT